MLPFYYFIAQFSPPYKISIFLCCSVCFYSVSLIHCFLNVIVLQPFWLVYFSGGCNLQVAGCRSEFIWHKVRLEVSCFNGTSKIVLPKGKNKSDITRESNPDIDGPVMLSIAVSLMMCDTMTIRLRKCFVGRSGWI